MKYTDLIFDPIEEEVEVPKTKYQVVRDFVVEKTPITNEQIDKAEKKQVKADIAALQKLLMKKPDKMTDSDLEEIRRAMGQLQSSSANVCRIAEDNPEGE